MYLGPPGPPGQMDVAIVPVYQLQVIPGMIYKVPVPVLGVHRTGNLRSCDIELGSYDGRT